MEVNACYDQEDERDYKYSDVFAEEIAWTDALLSKCILDNVEYQNQGLEDITKMMCVFYSTAHTNNEENYQEWSDVRIDAKEFWIIAKRKGRLSDKWALVSAWPKTARELNYIKGWTLIKTVNEAKLSIMNKRPIVVWSNTIQWSKWYEKPFVLWWDSGSWHAVCIIWYDDEYEGGCFIIKNSYWAERYDNWKMYLKYQDFGLLFWSKYSLIDTEDPIIAYKKKIKEMIDLDLAKTWYELWLWNGNNPREPISRQETIVVIMRAIEKLVEK